MTVGLVLGRLRRPTRHQTGEINVDGPADPRGFRRNTESRVSGDSYNATDRWSLWSQRPKNNSYLSTLVHESRVTAKKRKYHRGSDEPEGGRRP